jgi:hypothetical protein
MANASVPITPGAGASIDAHQVGNGDYQQIIRQVCADTIDTGGTPSWTAVTTGATPIAANESRVAMLIYNNSTCKIYLRFDTTLPVSAGTNAKWYLDPGDRFEVPYGLCQMPVSVVAATSGTGTVEFTPGNES